MGEEYYGNTKIKRREVVVGQGESIDGKDIVKFNVKAIRLRFFIDYSI